MPYNWWTPDKVEETLPRYRRLRHRLEEYMGSSDVSQARSRVAPGRLTDALQEALCVLVDLDMAIESQPGRAHTIAHLRWRQGWPVDRIAKRYRRKERWAAYRIAECLSHITNTLCGPSVALQVQKNFSDKEILRNQQLWTICEGIMTFSLQRMPEKGDVV